MRICGIDEAGSGSIAGSLFVCGVLCNNNEIINIKNIRDSKKLTRKQRDNIYKQALQLNVKHFVVKCSANDIDNFGISKCMNNALFSICMNLKSDTYLFDGSNNFGINHIKCIVKGDNIVPQISLASIIAKSYKDKESDELDKIYPNYMLYKNKGYCTKEHIGLIKQYGLSNIHRKSFKLKNI